MNLNSMKVAELRKELEDRGIDNVKSLKKAELIEKLQEVLDNEALEAELIGDEEPKPTTTPAPATATTAKTTSPVKPAVTNPPKAAPTSTTSAPAPTAVVTTSSTTSDVFSLEKKMARAEKFGVPIDNKTKMEMRAQKFGLASASDSSKAAQSAAINTADKLAARAAKFGVVPTSTLGKAKEEELKRKRAERFGLPDPSLEEEKKAKRAKRFSTPPVSSEEEEKRKKRAERFGAGQ